MLENRKALLNGRAFSYIFFSEGNLVFHFVRTDAAHYHRNGEHESGSKLLILVVCLERVPKTKETLSVTKFV